jgi:hypothetical protein
MMMATWKVVGELFDGEILWDAKLSNVSSVSAVCALANLVMKVSPFSFLNPPHARRHGHA